MLYAVKSRASYTEIGNKKDYISRCGFKFHAIQYIYLSLSLQAKSSTKVDVSNFLGWVAMEPQSVVWMPVLHRLAAAETGKVACLA